MKKFLFSMLAAMATMTMISCDSDDSVDGGGQQGGGQQTSKELRGMYVLNEGGWGANNATVDYLDLASTPVVYTTNLYGTVNSSEVMGLGDMGSDMKIYGGKLYIVVNSSNKLVIADALTCEKLAQVDIPNGRSLAFSGAYAYVSSYAGTSMAAGNASPGCVYKIDTLTMKTVARTDVGYQPEEMAVSGRLLYVANSGGYCAPDYDHTISVIDLPSFEVVKTIDVKTTDDAGKTEEGINLHRLRVDESGRLWLTSRGDYGERKPKLYMINPMTAEGITIKKVMDKAPSDFCIVGNTLYYYSSEWSYAMGRNINTYGIIDTDTQQEIATTLFKSPADEANIMTPYGIMVNHTGDERDFYILDAADYTISGKVHHFNADGSHDASYSAGYLPSRAVLLMK